MSLLRSQLMLALCAGAVSVSARAGETNAWPFWVTTTTPGTTLVQTHMLGPIFFQQAKPDGGSVSGMRPLVVTNTSKDEKTKDIYSLYPLLSYHSDPEAWRLSVFSILRAKGSRAAEKGRGAAQSFEVWPFYFARDNDATGDHYNAFFPLYGDITHRFGEDLWSFRLFPLYSRSEKNGRVTTKAPWPFLRFIDGAGHHGFEFWPLFGQREKAGDYRSQFYLWPLIYKNERQLSAPVPSVSKGFLPFYAATDSVSEKSCTYVWPFFGYSDRTAPYKYHQTNYLWPFLVQGHGDQREVNRWAPFYTHSVIKGKDKTWVAWPLWRKTVSRQGDVLETENKGALVFLKSTVQQSLKNPSAPPASLTHIWPLMSSWDNGAGKKQVQLLSPFEPLFSKNDPIRQSWSPLFALYRYNQTAPGQSKHSLLWDLVAYRREDGHKEFHIGPLFSTENGPQARVALGAGLVGMAKRSDGQWRPFLFKFNRRPAAATVSNDAHP